MPTYEYSCPKGHRFDVFQKMSDPAVAKCPECGADAERQIVPGAGFVLKGGGFYITDYRSEDYKKKAAVENPAAADSTPKKDTAAKESSKPEGGAKEKKQDTAAPEKPSKPSSPKSGKSTSGGDE